MSYLIRVWQACDLEGITKHLLIVGDVSADCAACRELGVDWQNSRECPGCRTVFRFIATRRTDGARGTNVRRIKDKRPDLTFIDYDDYKDITGKQQARDFFK